MKIREITLSKTSALHYYKLFLRSGLLFFTVAFYIYDKVTGISDIYNDYISRPWLLAILCGLFTFEMVLRFFPSHIESMGCQKQFYTNYKPRTNPNPIHRPKWRLITATAVWITLNALIFILYFTNVIDKGMMLIIALVYSVCDMVCILFFCPFETWFLKNKCCTTCRIYNWDYLMMFTPLIVIPHLAAKILVLFALILFLRWEITYWLHPEWFYEETNASLKCAHCTEKLCSHKRQLRKFHRKIMKKTLKVVKETTKKLR